MNKAQHIVVIDDDEVSRHVMCQIAQGAGYVVYESSSVSSGLSDALEKAPHIIILDLMLEEESGFHFLEKCRQDQKLSAIPVLVVSGLRDKDSVRKAISLGAKDYLAKPVDARILVQKLLKLSRDFQFRSVVFPKESLPQVRTRASGRILMGNEIGFSLEVPFKIAPDTSIDIHSPLIDELGCTDALFKKTNHIARVGFPGRFVNEIATVGLCPATVDRIRRITKGWK